MRQHGQRLLLLLAVLAAAPLLRGAQTPPSASQSIAIADEHLAQGRYLAALDVYDKIGAAQDAAARERALTGVVRASLRVAQFDRALGAAEQLERLAPARAAVAATVGDAFWSNGRFDEAERRFAEAARLDPAEPRALHGLARARAATGDLDGALTQAMEALRLSPLDGEVHHTIGTIYERLHRYDDAAASLSSYIASLPQKDSTDRALWSRMQVRFLRSFKGREPLSIDTKSRGRLHTVPFRVRRDKILVRARINGGVEQDFILDTGAEQTVITQRTARRSGVRPIVATLAAGVGDAGMRGLLLGRLDSLQIGTLKVHNVPALIKGTPFPGSPVTDADGLSPLALGLSMTVDYGTRQLIVGEHLPETAFDTELPLRMHRLAMVSGRINDDQPVSFVVDTGGELISISAGAARLLPKADRHIPLKVYGTSGRDRQAFLLPGVDLRFAAIHFPNFPVVVLNLRAPSALLGFEVGGIVGHRFLSKYRVDIDLSRSVVRLKTL